MHQSPNISIGPLLAGVVVFVLLAKAVGVTAAVVISLILAVCYLVANEWSWRQLERKEEQEIFAREERLREVVIKHSRVLLRKRRQGSFDDEYGLLNDKRWQRDLRHFVNVVLPSELDLKDLNELFDLPNAIEEILEEIDSESDSSVASVTPAVLSPQALGVEFEHQCAYALRALGWDARVTVASGDQGVDIEAKRSGYVLVIQCKLYTSPVGNGAVQEVAAGRLHYGADYAAVISNSSFTPSARQLAKTTGVLLLDYDELHMIDTLLFDDHAKSAVEDDFQQIQFNDSAPRFEARALAQADAETKLRTHESGFKGRFKRARPMMERRTAADIKRGTD